eukprot:73047_1
MSENENLDLNGISFEFLYTQNIFLFILLMCMGFSILFFILYYVVFRTTHLTKKNTFSIIRKICSAIHGLLIIVMSIGLEGTLVLELKAKNIYRPTSINQRIIASISIGYFIYDTIIVCIIYANKIFGKPDYLYIFHHIIGILTLLLTGIITVYSGFICIFAIFWYEVTNPLLHIPEIVRLLFKHDHNSLCYIICQSIYILLYIMIRFGICGHMIYQCIWQYNQVNILYKINSVAIAFLSLVLLPGTVKSLHRKITGYKTYQYSEVIQKSNSEIQSEMNEI